MHAAKLPTSREELDALITDCARYSEGLFSEKDVRKRHHLSEDIWTALGNNEDFLEKIEAEKARRIRDGSSARERAQRHFAVAPDILGTILNDVGASPRHRIESAKELRVVAANGQEAAPPSEIFRIVINLGNDQKLQFAGSVRPTPAGPDGKIIDHAPQELIAIAAANKREGGNGGEPI
jgi:hypothetical protein